MITSVIIKEIEDNFGPFRLSAILKNEFSLKFERWKQVNVQTLNDILKKDEFGKFAKANEIEVNNPERNTCFIYFITWEK